MTDSYVEKHSRRTVHLPGSFSLSNHQLLQPLIFLVIHQCPWFLCSDFLYDDSFNMIVWKRNLTGRLSSLGANFEVFVTAFLDISVNATKEEDKKGE